jgi:predicted nucleic acid-binding protein
LEVERFRRFLRDHHLLTVDSCIFNYSIDANPRYVDLTQELFIAIEQGANRGVASTISLTEILVHPYKRFGPQRRSELIALLTTFPNLAWVPPSLDIANHAAELRAHYGLNTPDAIIAATALESNSLALITNDSDFNKVTGLKALQLDRL